MRLITSQSKLEAEFTRLLRDHRALNRSMKSHVLSLYSGSGQTPGWPVSFSICVTTASSSRTSLG